MLRSKHPPPHSEAGFTLLETLVALSILAVVSGIAAAALKGPSPRLQLDNAVNEALEVASATRHRAVITQTAAHMPMTDCNNNDVDLWFFPDGTASNAQVCVTQSGLTRVLRISTLSGRLIPGETR
ncbi:MAG: type II secretion system protein [Sulfitobacter sp.]